jgi:thiol:disulfide interchange protein
VLIGLKTSGSALGWGFQLQEPMFVVVLITILFALSLSLFGVFEMGLSLGTVAHQHTQSQKGITTSLLSGVLTSVVAAPCTGPFLGSALGFAVTLDPLQGLIVFMVMGLGMALPYILLSFYPALIQYLPKSGPWLLPFKQLMGFLMLAATLWLLWVLSAQLTAENCAHTKYG